MSKYIVYDEAKGFKNEAYEEMQASALKDQAGYFDKLAKDVSWFKPYTQVRKHCLTCIDHR